MQALISALIAGGKARLDAAALDIAAIEFPSLVPGPYLQRLDEMGVELAEETEGLSGPEFVARANIYLFHDLGFRGNQGNYYDPKNSCLNWVLDQRTGIPITLSILYLEVARRAGRRSTASGCQDISWCSTTTANIPATSTRSMAAGFSAKAIAGIW